MTEANGGLAGLRSVLGGTVAVPGDAGYDPAALVWNGAIERRPSVIASCTSTADVVAALAYAQANGLEVSVRGGGHNYAGMALSDGGLTIDLGPMRSVVVDPAARRAVCGGGATWATLDAATQEHGLAVPGGFISTTGVGGLTLGGGFGWLSRVAGLTIDNLLGAEVVTADGRVLRASAEENADLFWALRGGGGNFGVVTSFEFALHPVGPMVHLGMFFFASESGGEMYRFARDFMRDLPDECGCLLAGMNVPPAPFAPEHLHFTPAYVLGVVGFGDAESHADQIAPVRSALTPLFELVTPIPYVALQQMFDESAAWGMLAYQKAIYLEELTDGAIDVITRHLPQKRSPMSLVPIFVLGGRYGREDEDATAFGGSRRLRYLINIDAAATDPDVLASDRDWARALWSDLIPHSAGVGSYVNFMNEYEEDRVRASYGQAKYARLAAIKAIYDPNNVFRLNANIVPAVSAAAPV